MGAREEIYEVAGRASAISLDGIDEVGKRYSSERQAGDVYGTRVGARDGLSGLRIKVVLTLSSQRL